MRKTALAVAGLAMLGTLQFIGPGSGPATQHENQRITTASTAIQELPGYSSSVVRDEDSSASALCKYFLTRIDEPSPHRALWFEDERQITLADKRVVAVRKAVTTGKKIDPAQCVPRGYSGGAEFLISTVSDPLNSYLALDYDRSLESIERAAAEAGYAFDRYWLPWNEAYTKPQIDLEKTRAMERERRLREEEPGVLIFHRQENRSDAVELLNLELLVEPKLSANPQLFVVFLVGETPSNGINKPALLKAIRYVQSLEETMPPPYLFQSADIRIAGPNVSASLHSLGVLLQGMLAESQQNNTRKSGRRGIPKCRQTCRDFPAIEIVSASVTNPDAIKGFQNTIGGITAKSGSPISFQSLAYDDEQQFEPIVSALRQITSAKACEIALISETASSYAGPAPPVTKGPGSQVPMNNTAGEKPCDPTSTDVNEVLYLNFPRNIAPLRNAYQAAQESLAASNTKESRLPQVRLPTNYREPEIRERDTVPALAQNQTPVSQDAVMQQIVQTLWQRKVKAAVISSSSTLDTLFLLHYFRESSPNVRLALPEADLLYVRIGESKDFTGTIVFGDHPLFVSSMFIPGPYQHRFASNSAESFYLAVLSILRPGLVYKSPVAEFPRAPFWMGVLGNAAYWPVRSISLTKTSPSDSSSQAFLSPPFTTPRPGWFWYFLVALLNALAALHCCQILCAWLSRHDGAMWWLEYFAIDHEPGDEYRLDRGCYLMLATLSVAAALWFVGVPTLRLCLESHERASKFWLGISAVPFVSCVLVIGFILYFIFEAWIRGMKEARSFRHALLAGCSVLVSSASLLAFAIAFYRWHKLCFGSDGLYFSYRATFVLSGVCPTLPALLIAAGIYVYAMGSMRRITYFQNRFASMPIKIEAANAGGAATDSNATTPGLFDDVLTSNFEKLQDGFQHSLEPCAFSSMRRHRLWLVMAAMVAIFLWGFDVSPASIEGRSYDGIIFAGACAIWVALLMTVLRFWCLWEVSRKMLRRLERLPLRCAFSRIPGLFSWTPIWKLGGVKRSMLVPSRSLEYLRCLSGVSAKGRLLIGHESESVEKALKAVLASETTGERITHQKSKALDDALCSMANDLLGRLIDNWKKGGADSESKEWHIRRKELPHGPGLRFNLDLRMMLASEFVALRFVAVIRYVSLQMRNLLAMMSLGFALLVLTLESYPFQPREKISWWILGSFAALSATVLLVFRGMSHELILKRLAAARSGKVDTAFLWPALKFGALPVLTVLASQFPWLSNFLFSWVEPALESLH